MINEDRKKLYDALSSEYDLGTYEEFERNIGDSVKRRKLYDAASADYDLGDFENYSQRIGPTHKESLDAFTAEHGSWLNDFEARDSAETNMSKAGMSSGIYVPAEGTITGEERKRYMELHKQEEALKKAWFTSDEYLAQKDADALFLSDARKGLSKQMMEYAQANPVLRQEGTFQINPYATRGAEADTELEKYRTASRILDDAIKMHNAPSKYDDKNVFLKFRKGAGDVLSDADFWTAGLTEIADNLGVRDVLSSVQEKLGNLNDLSEEAIENILSPAEKAVLQAWALDTQEQLKRKDDLSRAYQAGQSATESLGFMAEFALTGGIGKAATEGVEQMAKWLGKKALTKVGGMTDDVAAKVLKETGEKIAQSTIGKYGVGLAESLAEAAGRTGVMPSTFRNISEKATEIETDENGNNYLVKMNDAFAKGYVDSFIENLSEGGRVNALGTLFGDVAGKIPAYKKMVDKFSHTKASELWEAFNSSGVMNTLRAGGWHGLGEEYLEEWYGNALRTLTGVDKEALKDFATVDNQIVTLTSFLPMTIFGGTVSTAQVLSANKDLEKKAAALKSALMERGYDEAQANNMIDMMRGAAPAEVSETLTPIVNSVANRNTNEAAALMKPVGEFAAAVQRWQSFNTKYNYQEQEQRDGLRAQMEENLGQFWQQDENGRQTVQRGVNEKGEVVYMLGKPSVEDVEAGVTTEVAAVTSDGRKVFVNPSEYQLEDELEMNTFLGNEIMAEKGNQEQARMIEEKEAKIAAIRETAVPGTAVNIGTAEVPMQAIVLQRNPDGVIVNTPDGQTRQMTYEELGNYVGINAVPMTDAQIDEHEANVLTADRSQREAALDQEYNNEDAALEELSEAEDEIEQAVDANTPLPLKADGSVDQTALWNKDPEGWAKWNDEKRQDGGADSLAYVTNAITIEQAKMAELQAVRSQETDFDRRDALDAEIATAQERIDRLVAIQQGYLAQPAVADAVQNVQPEPQTEEERAAVEEQRREPFRKRAKELGEKLGVKINIAESLADVQEEQAREEIIGAEVSGSGARFPGWYNRDTGEVTIYLPHVRGVADIDRTIIHEVVAHKGLRGLLGKEGYNVLCDAVWDMMTEAERAKYMAYPGVNGDKRLAADEYIARFAEGLDLEQSRPIWNKIAEAVQKILNSMGIRLEVTKEDLADLIAASYMRLQEQARAAQTENAPVVEEVTEEIVPEATIEQQAETGADVEADIEEVTEESTSPIIAAAQQDKGGISFNVTTEDPLQDKIRKFAQTEEGKATGWTEDDIESIIAETESLIDAIHRSSTGNEFYDEFAYKEPTIRVDWRDGEAKPIVTWTRANIEYKYDMSADLLCINNEGLEAVLSSDKMVALMEMFVPEKKAKKGEPEIKFTSEDYLELYNTLKDLGFVVPCKGCFDAAGRFKMLPSVAQKFAAEVNAIIDERNKDPKAFDEKLKAKPGEKTVGGLPATAATKSAAIAAGVAGDNLTEHVKWTQLMSADGQTKMLSDWGGIFRAWQRTGAGRPKDKLLPEPYYGDIVSSVSTIIGKYGEKTPSFRDTLVNQGTGLRRNSHSEFRPVLAIDEIQFMRDAFIRNLTVFKYMKELDDVRLFGKMGVKFNMSFFPEYVPGTKVAGLDKDGNYIASEESVGSREFPYQGEDGKRHYDGMKGWEEAQKHINKDVSLSSVIFSIPHLLKALTDVPTPSDMRGIWGSLIPFHSSGATTASLAMQGLGMARANGVGHGFSEAFYDYGKGVTNFEAVQNDRFGEGWHIVSGTKAGTDVEPGHKLEFVNGNHYYNKALGVHLFASGYILDSELPAGVLGENGELDITNDQKKDLMHKFTIDYNDKVRELKGPYAYKDAADFYIAELPKLGLIPRFDFEVSEEKFLEMCEAANVDPRHPKLGWKGEGNSWSPIDSEAYYSLFCDYGMTDPATGEWAPHMPVGYVNEKGEREFRLPENAVEIVKEGLDRFSEVRRSENARIDEAIEAFAERSVEKGRISQKSVDKVLGKKSVPTKPAPKKSGVIDLVEEAKKAAKKDRVSFSVIGETGAMRDKTAEGLARMDNLEVARKMEAELNPDWSAKENENALKIKVATGWERGADGKWRYEVDDFMIKNENEWMDSKKKLTLRDIVEPHPVFDMYPDLLDIKIVKDRSKYNLGAYYDHKKNEMKLPFGALKDDADFARDFGYTPRESKSFMRTLQKMVMDILHEVQHAIQDREGFAPGGSSDMLMPEDRERYASLAKEYNALAEEYNAILDNEGYSKAAKEKLVQTERKEAEMKRFRQDHRIGGEDYKRLAGEVEAYNVETRHGLSDYERYNSLLSSTEDVARKDQIFLMDAVAGDAQNNISFRMTTEMKDIKEKAQADGTFMKAPNGQPTNLTEEQWLMVRTKNFINWFGDWENDPENASKVVDENGEPKVVYHQTNQKIYVNRETGENWDELGWKEKMEWDNRDDWEDYWEEQDFNTFSRVNARTTNEFDGFFFAPEYDEYHEYGDRTIAAFVNIKNPASREDYNIDSRYNDAGRNERIRLQEAGFDGVIRMDGDNVDEYIAFEPNQIKSATDNNGDFNPKNNNISFRITPEQDKAYMDAVESGDMETAQRMVDEAAKLAMPNTKVVDENGNPKVVYHGTTYGGFTKFTQSPDDYFAHTGFFFADTRTAVEDYTYGEGQDVDHFFPFDKRAEGQLEIVNDWLKTKAKGRNNQGIQVAEENGEWVIVDEKGNPIKDSRGNRKLSGKPSVVMGIIQAYEKHTPEFDGKGVYSTFLNLLNPLVIDAKGESWRSLPMVVDGIKIPSKYDSAQRGVVVTDDWVDYLQSEEGKKLGYDSLIVTDVYDSHTADGTITDYIAFDSAQIKLSAPVTYDNDGNVIPLSERFNPKKEDIRFRMVNENQAIFVSNAAKAVEGIKQEKATPEQWLKMIEKNGGLKAGEDKWMGLSDWLKASDKKTLTKQEVLDFVNEHMIVIEEQHYGEMDEETREFVTDNSIINMYGVSFRDSFNTAFVIEENFRGEWYVDVQDYEEAVSLYNEHNEDKITIDPADIEYESREETLLKEWATSVLKNAEQNDGVKPINATRKNYTTEGLDNLHEIALTVPTIESWNEEDDIHFGDAGDGRAVAWIRFGETEVTEQQSDNTKELQKQHDEALKRFKAASAANFEMSKESEKAWKEDGGYSWSDNRMPEEWQERRRKVVAELRESMKELNRLGVALDKKEGDVVKKVLVIDEIQSNRHQEGREKGYGKSEAYKEAVKRKNEADAAFTQYADYLKEKYGTNPYGGIRMDMLTAEEEAKRRELFLPLASAQADPALNEPGIPDAPFDKNWHELAMKRMLRYAAENGYDYIAWTKGAQQAERYDIGGAVESIYYAGSFKEGIKDIDINLDTRRGGNIHLQVDNDGKVINEYNDFGDVENSPYTGKNLSEILGKELSSKVLSLEEEQSLSGDGLRIGGEGMKGFYDKILPAFMNKYGKKWGVKVEDIELPNLEEAGRVMHSVPVTEEMKASVMEGQVMFRMRTEEEDAMEFAQSAIDDCLRRYNDVAEVKVFPVNEETAERFGYTLEELKKTGGEYLEDEDLIAIFANEDYDDSAIFENIFFHESIHKIASFFTEFVEIGEWLWNNAGEVGLQAVKTHIEENYKPSQYNEEMLTFGMSLAMSIGVAGKQEKAIPQIYRSAYRKILNEIGYEPEKESRRAEERISDSSRKEAHRNERKADEGGRGKEGETRTAELSAEERRVIGEYFPEFNKSEEEVMKAPNGKDSKLTKDQWNLVRSKEFIGWFGDWINDPENASKVVDPETGEPMLVYHGTVSSRFAEFNDEVRKNTKAPKGTYWFVDSKENAKTYASSEEGLYQCFLNLRNPAEIDVEGGAWYELPADYEVYDGNEIDEMFDTLEEAKAFARENGIDESTIKPRGETDTNAFVQRIKDKGVNDGAIIRNVIDAGDMAEDYSAEPATEFVVFKPNQISFRATSETAREILDAYEYGSGESLVQDVENALNDGSIDSDRLSDLVSAYRKEQEEGYERGDRFVETEDYVERMVDELESIAADRPSRTFAESSSKFQDEVNRLKREFKEKYGDKDMDEWSKEDYDTYIKAIGKLVSYLSGKGGVSFRTSLELDEEFGDAWRNQQNEGISFRVRTKPAPENTITVYKMVRLGEDGQPYPLFIGSAEPMPVKTWLDADSPNLGDLKKLPSGVHLINTKTGESMTLAEFEEAHPEMKNNSKKATNPTTEAINWATMNGMRFIKIVDKKTKQTRYSGEKRAYYNLGIDGGGSVSMYGMRPGWHAGSHPVMRQIGNGPEKNLRADNHVWVRGRISADVDYQAEANANPGNDIPTHIPTDGYYLKATNANAKASQADRMGWYISGSFIIDEFISDAEARRVIDVWNADHPDKKLEYDFPRESGVEFDPETDPRLNGVSFRTTGTPTDEVVANGLQLTPAQTAEVAANIFAALPEESREKITDGLNGNILGLQDAIMQIPTSLATKENWNEEDRAMADVVAEEMTKMAGEMTRPFSAPEALWLLYNNLNKGNDLISQASRALVQRNLGFDEETLERQEEAKRGVSFRMVGDATANAKASMYNRGAVNVWTRLKESFVDMQASVEELVSAIEKATGKEAKGFENILLALNQQSSKGLAAMESYEQRFLMPMFDEVRKIMDKAYAGYDTVVRYVILKHGLERNKKLAQRDAKAHYQEIYDEMIAKVNSMDDRQKRTYLTNAQLQDADAKAKLATLKAADTSAFTEEEKNAHKRELAKAKEEAKKAKENLERAQKINSMSEQELKDELDKVFEKIENGTDSVYKELRKNDYSGISSMFYDQLGVNRKDYSTEEEYQAALMLAKNDRFSSLEDVEAQAEGEVSSFEGRVDTKELWKRINAATKETLRQQYEANMISKDQYESLRNMFEYYVPLRGFKDNTAEDMYTYYRKPNSTGYTKPILGAEGRKTEAESPFGWIAAMAGSAIASNVKNEAKLALYYFVSNRPNNGIATLSRTWFVHTPGDVDANGKKIFKPAYPPFSEDLSSDAAKQAYEDWQEQMRELQKQGLAYEAGQRLNLGNAVVNISDANKPEHVVTVKVAGKDYTIVINGNPRAAQAINGELNLEGTADDYSAIFGPVLRWMSSVNTSYNPEFWITNLMRDMAFTWMAVNTKEDPAYRKKFSKNYWKCFRVIGLVAKNEKGTIGNSYMEDMYKDFVKYGGVTGYTQIKDSETWEKEIDNYLRSTSPESLKNGRMMRGMKTFFHAAHRFGESLEQVSRFAAFLTSREMGKTINEAIADAKEITVNFNRKGSGKMISLEESKYLTDKNGQPLSLPARWAAVGLSSIAPLGRRTIMFFNAAVQGLNSVYRLWKKNPRRLAGWTAAYFAIGVLNAAIHALLDDDDDYLDIPQYERRNSLMLGGNGAYLKWALPQEARAFYALGDLAVETVLGRNPHQNIIGESLKIATEVLPVNPAEGWKAFVPSVAIPAVELMLNEDYKGAPIYNEQKWLSDEERKRTAKWSSAYQGTGAMYKGIAQGLNYVTGGDKHDAGKVNLQPEKMEYIVQSAFGGTIRTADKFINTIWAMFDPEEDWTVRQTPFLNRILTLNDERFKNVHVNEVFDYYKADAEHALTLEKQYRKDKDLESLNELRQSEEYQWAKIYKRRKKALDNLKEKLKVAEGTAEKKELMRQQDEIKRQMIKEISEL